MVERTLVVFRIQNLPLGLVMMPLKQMIIISFISD